MKKSGYGSKGNFEDGINSKKYTSLTKVSKNTALRELNKKT